MPVKYQEVFHLLVKLMVLLKENNAMDRPENVGVSDQRQEKKLWAQERDLEMTSIVVCILLAFVFN